MGDPYNAQAVLDKIDWEGPEGIGWFQAEDAIDPDGEDSLYLAVQDARLGWFQYEHAVERIERIARDRNEVSDSDS